MLRALLICLALASPALADAPLAVTSAKVSYDQQGAGLAWTGLIEASDSFSLSFPNGGQVLAVHVEAGAEVQTGDLLAELDPTQAREALRAAEAQLAAAEASLLRQERELERDRQLAKQGYVSKVALDQAEEGLSSARSSRTQAATQVENAKQALADTRLIASRPALVLQRNAEAGQVVGPAQSVLDLAGLTGREAVFVAPADYDLRPLLDQPIKLRSLEPPQREMTATFYNIADMIDSATGGIRLKARLPDDQEPLVRINEPVEGMIPLPLGRVASLPSRALTRDGKGPAVWVIGEDQAVTLTPIALAHYSTDEIFLLEGLPEGARVVVDGAHLLYPNRRVTDRPIEEARP